MTDEQKKILLADLCARLPYGVICHANEINIDGKLIFVNKLHNIAALYHDNAIGKFKSCPINDIKPYLRPMSSMTKEECLMAYNLKAEEQFDELIDYYNERHIDYRGLIPKGLALEASKDMYNLKEK